MPPAGSQRVRGPGCQVGSGRDSLARRCSSCPLCSGAGRSGSPPPPRSHGNLRPLTAYFGVQVLLYDGSLSAYPARLADVRKFGEPVLGAHEIAAQTKAGVAVPAIGAGGLGLQPVQQGEALLPGSPQINDRFLLIELEDRTEEVVVLRPDDQRDVALERTRNELLFLDQPPVGPEWEFSLFGEEAHQAGFRRRGWVWGAPGE